MRAWFVIASLSVVCAASTAGIAVAQDSSEALADQCRVSVDRTASAGAFKVVRLEFDDGSCECAVTTGPTSQSAATESRVSSILESRECDEEPAVAMIWGDGTLLALAGVSAVGGIGAIILTDGEVRPVSP